MIISILILCLALFYFLECYWQPESHYNCNDRVPENSVYPMMMYGNFPGRSPKTVLVMQYRVIVAIISFAGIFGFSKVGKKSISIGYCVDCRFGRS